MNLSNKPDLLSLITFFLILLFIFFSIEASAKQKYSIFCSFSVLNMFFFLLTSIVDGKIIPITFFCIVNYNDDYVFYE